MVAIEEREQSIIQEEEQPVRQVQADSPRSAAAILTIGAFLFYLGTLAPTVLWGDDAFFQWSMATGYLQPDGGGHWLYFTLARLFTRLPIGDVAYRVNLFSAVCATLTILLIFATCRSLNLSSLASAAAALSLTTAHTFWTHAVRAEVYTLFTLTLATILWLLASWRKERPIYLFAAVFLFGPTLLSHQMGVFLLPTIVLLLWFRRTWLHIEDWVITVGALLVGIGIASWIIQNQVEQGSLLDSLYIYFTQSGADFSGSIFNYSLSQIPGDIGFWLALLALQFIGPALVLGVLGFWEMRKEPNLGLPLLLFFVITVLFAATYRVNDRYVFFLPGYLVFALMVGKGWEGLWEKRPTLAQIALPMLVLIPIATYMALPPLLQTAGFGLPDVRQLPGREPASFFLWPAKNGYRAAAEFGRSTLNALPPNSVLIADHTPFEPFNYLQQIEGVRPDVALVKVGPGQNIAAIVRGLGENRPIFLADNNPEYYNLSTLQDAVLVPEGLVYRLERVDG